MLYPAFIAKDETGAYPVFFPGLPGCFSHGASLPEAAANAVDALAVYAACSDAIPAPLDLERAGAALVKDGDASGLPGAWLMVPLLRDDGRIVRANISASAGMLETIDEAAKRRRVTRSSFLVEAAREKIAREG
jgi:predicted RNase H-like HicB family nuclease